MDTLSQAADAAGRGGGSAIFDFSDSKKPEGPRSPLDLANRLMERFGAEHFGEALKKTRSEVGHQMRLMQGAELGPRIWMSMSGAASFNAIQSTFAIGVKLRVSLSEANIEPQAKEGETVCILLGLTMGGAQGAEELANRLVGRDGLSPKQQANMFRLIAQTVDALPFTLWPEARLDVRMNLIDELKTLGSAFSSQAQQTKESADVKLERKLRQDRSRGK